MPALEPHPAMAYAAPSTCRKVTLRLYAGADDDLLAWLDALKDRPFGGKGEAVKAALRRGLQAHGREGGNLADPGVPAPGEDWLPHLRQVVEAAVLTALGNAGALAAANAPASASAATEAALDALGDALLL